MKNQLLPLNTFDAISITECLQLKLFHNIISSSCTSKSTSKKEQEQKQEQAFYCQKFLWQQKFPQNLLVFYE